MGYLIVTPRNKKEEKFIQDVLIRMNIAVSTEEQEDEALARAMKEVNHSKRVPLDEVKNYLRK